jgi:ferric-dicitrate binding protein FerR (iron transport regulator)
MNLLKIAPQLYKSQQQTSFYACLGVLCLAPSLLLLSSMAEARDAKASKLKPSTQAQSAMATDALDQARPSYIYRAKNTDTPESIAFEFLDQAHSLEKKQQFYAHNRIDKKAARKPVAQNTPFNIPVTWMYLKPSRASVLAVSGSVTVTLQAVQNVDASNTAKVSVIPNAPPKTTLAEGSRIQTAANSFASIALPDGSILSVEPNSDITLETLKQYASSDIFKINIVLNKGRVESEVKALTSSESTYTIKSKRLVTGVRGTRFAVSDSADGTGNGLLEVLEGAVAVGSPTQGALNTPKGFGRVVEVAEPSELIGLFSKPIWNCNRAADFSLGTHVSLAAPEKTVQLKLDIYSGKHGDITQLKTLNPLKQYIAQHASLNLDLDLPMGDYTAVARAIDVYGLQGYSAMQTITVKPPAPMALDERPDWTRNLETLSWVWKEHVASIATIPANPVQTQCSMN